MGRAAAAGVMSGRCRGGAAVRAVETAVSVTTTFDRKTSTKNALCEIIITFYANSTSFRSFSVRVCVRGSVCVWVYLCVFDAKRGVVGE